VWPYVEDEVFVSFSSAGFEQNRAAAGVSLRRGDDARLDIRYQSREVGDDLGRREHPEIEERLLRVIEDLLRGSV
jgi:hypothetical protein